MTPRRLSRFTLLGAGAVAGTIGPALVEQKWRPIAVHGRTPGSPRAATLSATLGAEAGLELDASIQASDLILIAVPDGQIPIVVADLLACEVDWKGKTVTHTSGALTSDELSVLADCGASVVASHPVQSLTSPARPDALRGAYVTVEGDAGARMMMREVFEAAGATVVAIDKSDKVAVHAAASVISNFTVTVAAIARELLQTTSLGEQHVVAMLQPLLEGTVANIAELGPERALTGPVVRGDTATVGRHVDLIARHAPHLMTAYVALATETVRVARKTARLSSSDAMDILDTVIAALPVKPADEEDD